MDIQQIDIHLLIKEEIHLILITLIKMDIFQVNNLIKFTNKVQVHM